MRTKKSPTSAARRPAAEKLPLPAWPTDWLNQQITVSGESAAALLRGFESMRRIQTRAAQQVYERHAAAGQLRDKGATDRLALQAELVRRDLDSATRCWQELFGAALETGAELWGCATHLVDTEDVFNAAHVLHA